MHVSLGHTIQKKEQFASITDAYKKKLQYYIYTVINGKSRKNQKMSKKYQGILFQEMIRIAVQETYVPKLAEMRNYIWIKEKSDD